MKIKITETSESRSLMTTTVTEIEADAKELQASNTLAGNFSNWLNQVFLRATPIDDLEPDDDPEDPEEDPETEG